MSGGSGNTLRYESAFADYRPFVEVEVIPWKKANSDAATLGGHAGHVTRATMPGTASTAAPSPSPRPAAAPMGHHGHPQR